MFSFPYSSFPLSCPRIGLAIDEFREVFFIILAQADICLGKQVGAFRISCFLKAVIRLMGCQEPTSQVSLLACQSNQFSSVAQSCLTLCNPMNCSTPGLPVHHQLPEFTQTHVHGVGDAIQPSHPLSSPSPPAPNPSQHQGLFQ